MKQSSWIGQTLNNRYQIQEMLGQGGMSAVYKAMDPNLRRIVAIKMVHPHLSSDESFIKRFMEEAAAIASLRHPNIVQVFDFSSDEDLNYMVMEYLPGETLQARLKRLNKNNRKMTIDEAVQITLNVCDGLSYAHKRGMVHRDVKPANIMLDINNQAILMDFGIVKIVGSAAHTLTGAVIGTANYMAPEIIRSEPADQRSDIYSLGITFFEMLSGKPPYDADFAMTIMMMHLNDPIPDLEIIRDDIPLELISILNKALAKDRNNRYQSVEELEKDLRKLLHSLSSPKIDVPEEKPNFSDQQEIQTPTQIIPPNEIADSNVTLVEAPKTSIVDDVPVTVVERPIRKETIGESGKKKEISKGLVGIIIAGLLVMAIVIIGFSTSWFGLSSENSNPEQINVEQTSHTESTAFALMIKNTEQAIQNQIQEDEEGLILTEEARNIMTNEAANEMNSGKNFGMPINGYWFHRRFSIFRNRI